MRITNKMMTNSSLANIFKNKNVLNKLDEQYTTGKKIQRPSDDPIIAVRALKLRTNVSEINQYFEKNIPDAKAWMDVTESALKTINSILTSVNTYCTQGASDPFTSADRESIVQNLYELKEEIYKQGDTNYAGRYVFTGYKTDSSLIYGEDESDKTYTITEKFTPDIMDQITYVSGVYQVEDYDSTTSTVHQFEQAPILNKTYRIRLSYDNLVANGLSDFTYTTTDASGTKTTTSLMSNVSFYKSSDTEAYNTASDGKIHYIEDTGELILPESTYKTLKGATGLEVKYDKKEFKQGDLRPENYFDCTTVDSFGKSITYQKTKQDIQYEINFQQKLIINTEGSDAIQHSLGRAIDEIVSAVNDVKATELKISKVNDLLKDTNITEEQKETLNELQNQLKTELALKNTIMRSKFQNGMTESKNQQEVLNIAVADLGSRYVRLELTENRLSSQQIDFEDLMATNEDADILETIIKYNSAQTLYNASLSAASKVVQNTLLDFL